MAVFQRDNVTFRYETVGNGPPVVFSHGLAWDMDRSLELLGPIEGHQLIVWDMRAHGASDFAGPADQLTFKTFADDLAALLDHLQIRRTVVGGISLGAGVAVEFAVKHSDRLSGLMLLQPAWLPDRHSTNLDWFIKIADLMDQFGIEEGLARLEQDAQFIDYRKSWPDAANSLAGQFQKPQAAQRSARLRQLPSDRPLGSWQPVAQLLTSTLVLGTERDPLHPLEYAEQWVSYFPIAQLKTAPPKSIDPGEYTQAIRNEVRRFLAAP